MLDDNCIRLRALERSDLIALHQWENISRWWRTSSTLAPYSLRNVMDYLASYDADPFHSGQLRLIIERKEGEEPVGFVELYDVEVRHRRANVGILIAPSHQRRHMASRALRLLEGYCGKHLMLRQLLAYVPADNLPSLSLFEREGYVRVATLPEWLTADGSWIDATVWQKFLVTPTVSNQPIDQ